MWKVSQLELYTIPAHLSWLGWLSSYTNITGWFIYLFFFWFTNMPLRSTDQQLAFWVLCFSAWCAVSLRISVQTASLWQRARWVASDTTSQTTHQTNTLKALSTLILHHLIYDWSIYWHYYSLLSVTVILMRYAVGLHIFMYYTVTPSHDSGVLQFAITAVFYRIGMWCEHVCIFLILSQIWWRRS